MGNSLFKIECDTLGSCDGISKTTWKSCRTSRSSLYFLFSLSLQPTRRTLSDSINNTSACNDEIVSQLNFICSRQTSASHIYKQLPIARPACADITNALGNFIHRAASCSRLRESRRVLSKKSSPVRRPTCKHIQKDMNERLPLWDADFLWISSLSASFYLCARQKRQVLLDYDP